MLANEKVRKVGSYIFSVLTIIMGLVFLYRMLRDLCEVFMCK